MLLWRVYLCFYACLMWQTLFAQEKFFNDKLDSTEALEHSLKALDKLCIENSLSQRIPFYLLCFGRSVFLVDYDFQSNVVTETQVLGYFDPKQSAGSTQIYVSSEENCLTPEDAASANRTTVAVRVECCGQHTDKLLDNSLSGSKRGDKQSSKAFIHSVTSSDACSYQMLVCSDVVCAEQHQSSIPVRNSKKRSQYSEDHAVTIAQQVELRNRTRDLFYHAYSSYMTHAFPEGELRPVSCEGGPFELIKIPYVTLIDTLDTLVVMGDFEEFRKASRLLMTKLPNFDFDVNVSLFETTIRLLGGLLSAHLFSIDPTLRIYPTDGSDGTYDGDLLRLAVDLGDRLLPAFATKTGIPFGTVNLRHGVPKGETKIASTAGAGTLLLEFEILSILTSEEKYGKAALVALEGIYSRKSDFDLVGKHINTETGQWLETLSGVGSNSDSFYEYLLKGYSLMHHIPLFQKFSKTYRAIKHLILIDDEWFSEVDMYSGKLQRRRVENLDAFWPGMEALLGRSESAALQLNALYSIWHDLGFLPEELDQGTWEAGKSAANPHYALRPELVESTYYQYRATGQRSWLAAGKHFLHSLEQYTRTGCGFAAINDVASLELHDSMPSFFLSETCKYMYLLFDEDNFLHRRPFVLSTEAHPFDLNQLHLIKRLQQQRHLLPTLQEEITPQHEEARHMLLTQRRQRRKRLQRNKMSSMLMMSVVAPSPQQIEGIETATSEENGSLPLRCAPLPYQTAMTSSYMKILLYRDGSKLQRFPPLFSALKYLEQEKEVVPRSDEEGDVNDVLTARRVLSFRKEQLTRSLKNVITLLDHRKLLTNSAASTASEESKKCPVKALKGKDVSDEGLSAGKESLQSVSSASSAASEEIPATKVLELSLGSLGQFKIQVHPDGFHISNKQDDRTLDISNVGKRSIFVRESDHDGVRTMMARQGATVHSCVIEASFNDSTSTPWRRHCALANFGPSAPIQVSGDLFIAEESDLGLLCNKGSASQANSAMTQVASLLRKSFLPTVSQSAIAALLEKGDNLFASKLNWWKKLKETSLLQFGAQKLTIEIETDDTSSSDSEVSKVVNSLLASKVTSETTDVNEDNMLSSEMTEEEEETFTTSSVQSDDSTDVDLSRRIVLVKRGDCLFEEKALNAQQRGGVALLVQNRENNLFIMAGKRDVEELHAESNSAHSNNPSQVSSKLESESSNAEVSRQSSESPQLFGQTSKSQSTSSAVKIPTVMVADLDARELIQLSSSSPFTSQISLDIQSVHSLLMSDLFGNLQYPKVWMTKSVIYVHTKGLWGAYFKSQKGEEWQMYLIDKRDSSSLRLIPPMTIRNANGVKMTTTSTLMQSPEQIYSLTLKRKCPRHVKVTKDGRSVQVAS